MWADALTARGAFDSESPLSLYFLVSLRRLRTDSGLQTISHFRTSLFSTPSSKRERHEYCSLFGTDPGMFDTDRATKNAGVDHLLG